MPQPTLSTLDHLVLTVADVERTLRFYEIVLGMAAEQFKVADGTTRWALKFGSMKINLHAAGREFDPKALHPTPGSADLCFLTDRPLGDWTDHLSTQGIAVEQGPIPRTGAVTALMSLYIRDPDGNLIEIAEKR